MQRLARVIGSATGWRRRALAVVSGACGALALAPIGFWPAIAVPLVVSIWLIDGAVARAAKAQPFAGVDRAGLIEAAGIGWWIGFGYFVAGLWWLGAAFLVEAEEFAWALPLGVAGLPAVLACFTAAGFAAARALWTPGAARILAFAVAVGVSEWLRGVLFTGFPWNAFGMALGGDLTLAQAASLVGLHGLTFLTLAIFAAPALLADAAPWRMRLAGAGGAALALAALATFGVTRLAGNETAFAEGVRLRIMQPNTPQDEKFRPENRDRILAHYLRLSASPTAQAPQGLRDVTHLIWPESPFPFFLARDPAALAWIGETMGETVLVTGAARMETAEGALPGEIGKVSYFNDISAIAEGRILDSYDKAHLVPFGEYLPFSGLLESLGLRQFVHIPGGFDAGPGPKLLEVPGLPNVFPLVCYEAIFPGVLDPAQRVGTGLIVNVTNDGWFGRTAGPYQHLAQARLRAIELGLPLVRSANTGISAAIDPYGRILASLRLGAEGVLDVGLPRPAEATLYSRAPMLSPILLYVFGFVLLLAGRSRR